MAHCDRLFSKRQNCSMIQDASECINLTEDDDDDDLIIEPSSTNSVGTERIHTLESLKDSLIEQLVLEKGAYGKDKNKKQIRQEHSYSVRGDIPIRPVIRKIRNAHHKGPVNKKSVKFDKGSRRNKPIEVAPMQSDRVYVGESKIRSCVVKRSKKQERFHTVSSQTEARLEEVIEIIDDEETERDSWKRMLFGDLVSCLDRNSMGNCPIHEAVMDNDLIQVRRQCFALKVRKVSIDIENNQSLTALQLAALNDSNVEIVKQLVSYGSDIKKINSDNGDSILHILSTSSSEETLRFLLDLKLYSDRDLDAFNYEGYTPLMLSVLNRKANLAELLLENGANPDIRDIKSGRTALFHAVEINHSRTIQVLVNHGADPAVANFDDKLPEMGEIDNIDDRIRLIIDPLFREEIVDDSISRKRCVMIDAATNKRTKM